MNLDKLREAKDLFTQAVNYGSDNAAVTLTAKGLVALTDAIFAIAQEIQTLKTKADQAQD